VGGFAYLAQIAENTPSISNIKTYAIQWNLAVF
jgi:replicative DNA helicase